MLTKLVLAIAIFLSIITILLLIYVAIRNSILKYRLDDMDRGNVC